MQIFDPERFAVGGTVGHPGDVPGRPIAAVGVVREIRPDPEDLPIPLVTFTVAELSTACGFVGAPSTLPTLIKRGEVPPPLMAATGLRGQPVHCYSLPQAEAIVAYFELRQRGKLFGGRAASSRDDTLESARQTMLSLVTAANDEIMEII